ncbi:conserved hypothetical protein [Leishmania major strain Friedlin]|uniref:ATP-grasp domain-containing protein n=1 Tax=Leishmania major TaxID=5664 RepID=Q4Q9R1_LEIMA|nr:conserved hypothetical protein [Leishmania major strain Friedlin]CAJ05423.1 conserved hypothetical protein [Leishmania major strain Friedlin]|eukprot:XP_001683937.1 conserved hypothetical protein [Leishmania major strain Friedlin]
MSFAVSPRRLALCGVCKCPSPGDGEASIDPHPTPTTTRAHKHSGTPRPSSSSSNPTPPLLPPGPCRRALTRSVCACEHSRIAGRRCRPAPLPFPSLESLTGEGSTLPIDGAFTSYSFCSLLALAFTLPSSCMDQLIPARTPTHPTPRHKHTHTQNNHRLDHSRAQCQTCVHAHTRARAHVRVRLCTPIHTKHRQLAHHRKRISPIFKVKCPIAREREGGRGTHARTHTHTHTHRHTDTHVNAGLRTPALAEESPSSYLSSSSFMIPRGGMGAARWAAGALRCLHYSPNAAAILALTAPLSTCRVQLLHHWVGTAPRTALVVGTAFVYQQRLYASTAASGSNGASHGHDHRFSDGKNGAAGSSGFSSAHSSAGGGGGINGYGGGSGSRGNGAAKRIRKVKASRRVLKTKRAGPKAKAASTPASSTSGGSAATASASAASGGASANQGSGAGSSGSGSGGGIVASPSPGAAYAQSRTTAPRRKKKSSRVPPPPPGSSAAARGSRHPLTGKRVSTGSLSGTGATPKKAVTVAHAASHGRSAVSAPSATAAVRAKAKKRKRIRICVLSSSYDGTDSATASVDNYWCTPQHYIKKDRHKYSFADVSMKKIDSYRTVRKLVTSSKYDVFFNLCDGGRDEKRAGVDVVEALEEQNAAFTGTDSRGFEPSKIDMKLMVGSSGVKVPNFVLLSNAESLAKKCRHLKFPVIVKHLSGYASVGIQKDSRCDTLDQLRTKVRGFIKEYNHALVEEFIRGREGTVLACADPGSPFGVKVFKPLMFNFLQNNDDFAYFEKKWTMECGDQAYGFLASSDPAYTAITEMARNAFKYIMNGVGYGRVDFRIDELTGEPYFLEINPNCGMWYAPKDGGDFADVMVEGDPHWNHERFVANAVARALRDQAARKPWYFISHDRNGQFSTRASKTVAAGKCLFGDAVHPIPVVAKSLYKLGEEEPTVGCVICRGDGIHQAVALRHSCEPNMGFVHGRTLLFAAKRQINVGEELTVDYATLRDESMPHFVCSCGTENCRSVIFPMPAMPRTVEAKTMKRLLREKKQVWMKEKANREAERILKKRSSRAPSSSASGSGSGGGGSSAGSSSSTGHASSSASGGASSSSGSGSSSGISASERK